jgi:hypothetical protein
LRGPKESFSMQIDINIGFLVRQASIWSPLVIVKVWSICAVEVLQWFRKHSFALPQLLSKFDRLPNWKFDF